MVRPYCTCSRWGMGAWWYFFCFCIAIRCFLFLFSSPLLALHENGYIMPHKGWRVVIKELKQTHAWHTCARRIATRESWSNIKSQTWLVSRHVIRKMQKKKKKKKKKKKGQRMTKPSKWHVRPGKTQISLDIRPVWSVFAVRIERAWVLSYPLSAQRRLIRLGGP